MKVLKSFQTDKATKLRFDLNDEITEVENEKYFLTCYIVVEKEYDHPDPEVGLLGGWYARGYNITDIIEVYDMDEAEVVNITDEEKQELLKLINYTPYECQY